MQNTQNEINKFFIEMSYVQLENILMMYAFIIVDGVIKLSTLL